MNQKVTGSVVVSSWAEALRRCRKIKTLTKKMKLQDVGVTLTSFPAGYKKEKYKLTWSYSSN